MTPNFVNRFFNISILLLLFAVSSMKADCLNDSTSQRLHTDSLHQIAFKPDSASRSNQLLDSAKMHAFKPDPIKSVWMGAIIPGYGQILNRKYWKLPLVYGGFLGCAYALSWNNSMYSTYKKAYRDFTDNDPNTTSYLDVLPKGRTVAEIGESTFKSALKSKQDFYRRYRDLSIIATIGYYALTLVDAYVDAQLYDFDITPDLSFKVQPTLIPNSNGLRNTLAMQCCFRLK